EYDVGFELPPGQADAVAAKLVALKDDTAGLRATRANALKTYRRYFSKGLINDRWSALLEDELGRRPRGQTVSVTK
ncbi:MAG TPA: hypothetical protein VMT47_12660, partial [Polyangia bacterium]|nr:hypothetical protein [Polyangia bacterium]